MSGDTSKCNYPGACRIVDAYFRLNLSGWVWFYWSVFSWLGVSLVWARLYALILSILRVSLFMTLSLVLEVAFLLVFTLLLTLCFLLQFPALFRNRDLTLSVGNLHCPTRWDGWGGSGIDVLHESESSHPCSLHLYDSAIWGLLIFSNLLRLCA